MSYSVSTFFIGVKDLHLSHDLLDRFNYANAIKVFWHDCGAIPCHGVRGHIVICGHPPSYSAYGSIDTGKHEHF